MATIVSRGMSKSLVAAEMNCTSQGPLVGVYDRVHLDATFLLARPGMPSNSLENGIGEQRDGSGIDDYPSVPSRQLSDESSVLLAA